MSLDIREELQRYRTAMKEKGLVGKAAYWGAVWVTRFLHSEFCRSDEPVSVQAQRFLEDAAVKYPLQKRQLVSAQQALSLYVGLEQGNLRTSAWPQLIDRLRHQMRVRHYAPRTESTYVDWVRRFLTWHEAKSPHMAVQTLALQEFLEHLAVERNVAASTQNQALNALVFFFREVLELEVENLQAPRAKRSLHLPEVMSRNEARQVLDALDGTYRLMASLLYGSGIRLIECVRLRVKDIDFEHMQILVRDGKGGKDRIAPLPSALEKPLSAHINLVRAMHQRDLADGFGSVFLPHALAAKNPHAATDWRWQWVFPAQKLSVDPATGERRRHHIHESGLQKAVQGAVARAGIPRRISCHTFRHSFATHLIENGYDIRTVQELLGHSHVNTTMIYVHVLNRGGRGVQSPLDV